MATFGVDRLAGGCLPHGQLNAAKGSVVRYTGCAIVNAANEGCLSGGGVDGAITNAGGPPLADARRSLPIVDGKGGGLVRCPTGDAKTTIAGELGCEWVIHAVGPNYRMCESDGIADTLLYRAYFSAMREARKKSMPNLAFSLLSAGIFRGKRSLREVLLIGMLAIESASYEGLQDVFLVGYTAEEVAVLTQLIDDLFGQGANGPTRSALLEGLSPEVRELHQRALEGALNDVDAVRAMRTDMEDTQAPRMAANSYTETDTRLASVLMVIVQITCWIGFFDAEYGSYDAAVYEMYLGIALMMLVGFGYLMTFLKWYGMGAVGFTFIITVLSVQINTLLAAYLSPNSGRPTIDGASLMDGNFGAAVILISYGCMIGKASPSQLMILTIVESLVFQVRRPLGHRLPTHQATSVIHKTTRLSVSLPRLC